MWYCSFVVDFFFIYNIRHRCKIVNIASPVVIQNSNNLLDERKYMTISAGSLIFHSSIRSTGRLGNYCHVDYNYGRGKSHRSM